MSKTSTRVPFQAGDSLVPIMIQRQNGSPARAFLELVSNAIDAGAKRLEIITHGPLSDEDGARIRLTLQDDGRGLPQDEEQLNKEFSLLGRNTGDEPDANKPFGEFHLGRLQILNFAKVSWASGRFVVSCDIDNFMGIEVYESNGDLEVPGTCVTIDFDPKKMGGVSIESLLSSVTNWTPYVNLDMFIDDKKVDRTPMEWDKRLPTFQVKVQLDSLTNGWRIYHHGVYVNTIDGEQCRMPTIVNVTTRIRTSISRTDIMDSDPVWKEVRAEVTKITNKTLLEKNEPRGLAQLRAMWQHLLESDQPVAVLKNLKCIRLINDDTVTLPELHSMCDGALSFQNRDSYYARWLQRTGLAAVVDAGCLPWVFTENHCARINHIAQKLNLTFSLFEPGSITPIGGGGSSESVQDLLARTKVPKTSEVLFDRVSKTFTQIVQEIIYDRPFQELRLSSAPLPAMLLINYPNAKEPVFTDAKSTIVVSLEYFSKLKLRDPDSLCPFVDRLLRSWLWLSAKSRAIDEERSDAEAIFAKYSLAVYVPIAAELIKRLSKLRKS